MILKTTDLHVAVPHGVRSPQQDQITRHLGVLLQPDNVSNTHILGHHLKNGVQDDLKRSGIRNGDGTYERNELDLASLKWWC